MPSFFNDSVTCQDLPIGGEYSIQGYKGRRKSKGMKRSVQQTNKRGDGLQESTNPLMHRCTPHIPGQADWAFVASKSRAATTGLHLGDVERSLVVRVLFRRIRVSHCIWSLYL